MFLKSIYCNYSRSIFYFGCCEYIYAFTNSKNAALSCGNSLIGLIIGVILSLSIVFESSVTTISILSVSYIMSPEELQTTRKY